MLQKPVAPSLLFKPIQPLTFHLSFSPFSSSIHLPSSIKCCKNTWVNQCAMELGRSTRSHTSSFVFLYVFPAVLAGERRRTAAQGKPCFFFDSFKPASLSNFISHPFLFLLRPSSASHHKRRFPAILVGGRRW